MEAFYKIDNIRLLENNETEVSVWINKDYPVYQGHFPGHPITPGVMLVQLCIDVIDSQLGKDYELASAKNVKFILPHYPQESPNLSIRFGGSQGNMNVKILSGDKVIAKMTFELRPVSELL